MPHRVHTRSPRTGRRSILFRQQYGSAGFNSSVCSLPSQRGEGEQWSAEGIGIPWRLCSWPSQPCSSISKAGEIDGEGAVDGGGGARAQPGVVAGEEGAPPGRGGDHRRLVGARPGDGQGPGGVREVARRDGVPRLPQGGEGGAGGRHGEGQLHHRTPRPRLPRQRAPVRGRLPAQRPPARRARLQRRHLPPDRPQADVHRRRVRDERRRQPPRPLPPRQPPPRRPKAVRLPFPPPHHPRLHHREHEHIGRQRAAEGRAGGSPRARRRAGRQEQLRHDRRRRVRRREGLQGQQDMQHADDAGVPPEVPRGDRDRVRVALPGLHRHHRPLPRAHSSLPPPLPAIPEVHHQGLRLRGGIRQAAGSGGERPEPDQVGRLLELEQGLRQLREPAVGGSQRRRKGQKGLGDQREVGRLNRLICCSRLTFRHCYQRAVLLQFSFPSG